MKQRIVIYHGGCPDGFTAAWAAWRRWGDEDTEYFAASHTSKEPPPPYQDREVIVLDFSYSLEVTRRIANEARRLVVLDHHQSAVDELATLVSAPVTPNRLEIERALSRPRGTRPWVQLDTRRSGAGLAWDILHGSTRPWLIDYVEDRDLWLWKQLESKVVNAWIGAQPMESFQEWDRLRAAGWSAGLVPGQGIVAYVEQYVREAVRNAALVEFDDYTVPMVNCSYKLMSEVVGALAEKHAFAIGWFQKPNGAFKYSLRSRRADGADVSVIARQHGGGGHRNASSFESGELLGRSPRWGMLEGRRFT